MYEELESRHNSTDMKHFIRMSLFMFCNIYGAVSIIFYVIVSYLTVRERKYFKSSFVKLWITLAVLNICSYLTMYIAIRLPKATPKDSMLGGFLSDFSFTKILPIVNFFVYYLIYCQHLAMFMSVLNRLRSIACPLSREAIWDTHFWLTVVFILAFPFCFCYEILFIPASYKYRSRINGYILLPNNRTSTDLLLRLTVFQCVITILCVLMNLTAVLQLCRRSMSSNYRRERNLFCITFLGFCVQAVNSSIAAALYICPPETKASAVAIHLLPLCNDLFSLSYPYFFIMFNQRIRTCLFRLPIFTWFERVKILHKCEKPYPVLV